jgi:hypothetical protein
MPQQLETKIRNLSRLAIGRRRDVISWVQIVGKFRALNNPDHVIEIGIPGMADVGLAVAVTITPEMVGRTIAVAANAEFKTHKPGSKQEPAQINWQAAFTKRGGQYRVVRSVDDLLQFIDDIQAGRWTE